MRNRRKRIMILLFLSPVVILLLAPFFERLRGQISLSHFKRHLASRGFKLTVAEFRSLQPQGENGAPALLQAAEELPSASAVQTNPPPRMELTPSGRAIIGLHEEEWIGSKTTNRWTEIAAELEQNESTLQVMRAALSKPVLDNQVDLA